MSSQKSNNLVRQVLKEIISEPPSSTRKSCDIEQLKLAQAVTYLQRKIERQQTQVKVFSEQLGREIEAKEHLIMLLNEEKEKNCKLTQHLNNSNRTAAESKKKLSKFQLLQNREAKIKQEYEVKMAKCKQFLRKKEELLTKANVKIEELQKNYPNISSIQGELKSLREKVLHMKNREDQLEKENGAFRIEIKQLRQQLQLKDETLLFSEEHLRRLREEYEQLEEGHNHEQEESRQLQIEMKELLQQQNDQIKQLNQRLKFKEEIEECIKSEKSLQKSQICSFAPEKPEWELTIFKNQIKRTFDAHMKEGQLKQGLQSDIMLIFQAVETSFNSILSQVLNGLE